MSLKTLCPPAEIPYLSDLDVAMYACVSSKSRHGAIFGRPVPAGLRVGDRAVIARRPTRRSSWCHGVGLRAVAARLLGSVPAGRGAVPES